MIEVEVGRRVRLWYCDVRLEAGCGRAALSDGGAGDGGWGRSGSRLDSASHARMQTTVVGGEFVITTRWHCSLVT